MGMDAVSCASAGFILLPWVSSVWGKAPFGGIKNVEATVTSPDGVGLWVGVRLDP